MCTKFLNKGHSSQLQKEQVALLNLSNTHTHTYHRHEACSSQSSHTHTHTHARSLQLSITWAWSASPGSQRPLGVVPFAFWPRPSPASEGGLSGRHSLPVLMAARRQRPEPPALCMCAALLSAVGLCASVPAGGEQAARLGAGHQALRTHPAWAPDRPSPFPVLTS